MILNGSKLVVSPEAISMFSKNNLKKLCNNSRTITRFHNSEQHPVPDFKSRFSHLDSVNDPPVLVFWYKYGHYKTSQLFFLV